MQGLTSLIIFSKWLELKLSSSAFPMVLLYGAIHILAQFGGGLWRGQTVVAKLYAIANYH